MQNEAFECCDEVEPRRMPEQTSKFDSRPIPVVPEVSLILEKSQQAKRMDDTTANNMPEIRSSIQRDGTIKGGESYAAWKEKQFPQQSIRTTPNRLHEIYSSTHIANSTQNSPTFNQSYSRDPKYINQSSGADTPRKFSMSRTDGQLQNSNKYVLSHPRMGNENHYHLNGSPSHHQLTRSHSTDSRISSERRSDHDAYESRFHNKDDIRSHYDRKPSDYGRGSNLIDKRSDQDAYASRHHNQDGTMSPQNPKGSDSDRYVPRHYSKDEKRSPGHIRRDNHSHNSDSNDRKSEHSHEVESGDRKRSEHSHGLESGDRRRSDNSHTSESSNNRRSDYSHSSESSSHRRSDHSHPRESGSRRSSDHSHPPESSSRRSSDHSHALQTYDTRPKARIQRSSSCSKADSFMQRNTSLDHEYHPKHSRSLQPVHCSPEHSHSYSHHHYTSCCTNHSSSNSETETVKNLLNVITSQNEQIKNLQKQVERLLKLHEETLKDKHQCGCQPNGRVYQNSHHSYECMNGYEQSRAPSLPIAHNNGLNDNERYNVEKRFSDLNMQDEQNQQAILEQKVSIGVMTSFELKLQNNPNLGGDNELKHRNSHEKVLPSSNIMKNLVNDPGEMIRKKSNYFNPHALENISEASESHMSSLRQSHLCSDTTRQSIEAQDSVDVQSANQYKNHYDESQNRVHETSKKVPRNEMNLSNGKNGKRKTNGIYKANDQRFEENDNHVENVSPFVYNFEYDNVCSSPQNNFTDKRTDEFNAQPLLTDITKMKSNKCDNFPDDNLSLSSSDLDAEDFNPQSPEPSIHLDMQEYSSEGGSLPPQRAGKVGWTIYNNVLDQVNKILQNTRDDSDDEEEEPPPNGVRKNDKKEYDNNIMGAVKAATMEQLTKLGISFSDNEQREPSYNKKVVFDQTSYYARQGPEGHMAAASGSIETNTSMHMKALAMKYLNEEQLADMAMQKPRAGALKQVPANGQNTNMSFATMHYLQRYHLLPGNGNPGAVREAQVMREDYRGPAPVVMNERPAIRNAEMREPSPHRYMPFTGTSKASYPSKILDISTLKQQPKLL